MLRSVADELRLYLTLGERDFHANVSLNKCCVMDGRFVRGVANLQGDLQQRLYLAHILPASILLTSCEVIQDLWFQPFCPGPSVSFPCSPLGTFLVPFPL